MAHAGVGMRDGDDHVAQPARREPATLGVEIQFYRPDEPITIPLPQYDPVQAQSYFERLKSDVIEAQLHSAPRVTIAPVARGHDALVLDPMTIKQVILVDRAASDEPTTDELPTVVDEGDIENSLGDPKVPGAELTPDQQRRIEIMLE